MFELIFSQYNYLRPDRLDEKENQKTWKSWTCARSRISQSFLHSCYLIFSHSFLENNRDLIFRVSKELCYLSPDLQILYINLLPLHCCLFIVRKFHLIHTISRRMIWHKHSFIPQIILQRCLFARIYESFDEMATLV